MNQPNLYQHNPHTNWLPYDGVVRYWGQTFDAAIADHYYQQLMQHIAWKNDEAVIFGKHIITQRKVAWYADTPYTYTYSKISRTALLWTDLLLTIKTHVESQTGQHYNSCLLNLYHNGQEGMAWHSDDERDLQRNGSIASISLGATRKFAIKHKTSKHKVVFELQHGDLLEMQGEVQQHWLHSIPTTKKIHTPRINLTFRQMVK